MALKISGLIDLDSMIFRDQAKCLQALADLEDLALQKRIKFKMEGEEAPKQEEATPPKPAPEPEISKEVPVEPKPEPPKKGKPPKAKATNNVVPMNPAVVPLESAETKILNALKASKGSNFAQLMEATKLVIGTLSPNISRMVKAGKIVRIVPGTTDDKRASRDNIIYTIAREG